MWYGWRADGWNVPDGAGGVGRAEKVIVLMAVCLE